MRSGRSRRTPLRNRSREGDRVRRHHRADRHPIRRMTTHRKSPLEPWLNAVIAQGPRAPAAGPPKGFRPHMSMQAKLLAALRAAGLDPDQGIEWHHDPPLQQRVWDPFIQDTSPTANDPRFIVPLQKAAHRERTAKHDVPEIAKTRRLAKGQEAFRAKMLEQDKDQPASKRTRWGSRPFRRKRP